MRLPILHKDLATALNSDVSTGFWVYPSGEYERVRTHVETVKRKLRYAAATQYWRQAALKAGWIRISYDSNNNEISIECLNKLTKEAVQCTINLIESLYPHSINIEIWKNANEYIPSGGYHTELSIKQFKFLMKKLQDN